MKAIAYINNNNTVLSWVEYEDMSGIVYFSQETPESPVLVQYELYMLEDGYHGFHVHDSPLTLGNIENENPCETCGGHFNGGYPNWSPQNTSGTPHGEHVGDLCFNILSKNGKALGSFWDSNISIYPGQYNTIVGKSIMVHQNQDDMGMGDNEESLITGNAGKRVMCANIEYL